MAKGKSVKVRMVSAESPHFYTTTKNPKLAHKLSLRRYDPILRRHTLHEEKKIK